MEQINSENVATGEAGTAEKAGTKEPKVTITIGSEAGHKLKDYLARSGKITLLVTDFVVRNIDQLIDQEESNPQAQERHRSQQYGILSSIENKLCNLFRETSALTEQLAAARFEIRAQTDTIATDEKQSKSWDSHLCHEPVYLSGNRSAESGCSSHKHHSKVSHR